jgi:class 3 adenylate cyclase
MPAMPRCPIFLITAPTVGPGAGSARELSEGRFRGLVQFSLRTGDCLRQHLHCSGRVAAGIEKVIPLEDLGSLALKGISQPVSAFNVPLAATQPALRVIEGAPPSG